MHAFSLWLGIVIGGVLALIFAGLPRSRGRDGSLSLQGVAGVWLGGVGPLLGGVAALIVWLVD